MICSRRIENKYCKPHAVEKVYKTLLIHKDLYTFSRNEVYRYTS
jgi:hypothetical protein